MKKFTNRALSANFEKCKGLASLWLGKVVKRRLDGSVCTESKIFPNYWRCVGWVDMSILDCTRLGNEVISSGCFACVPCEIPTAWRH